MADWWHVAAEVGTLVAPAGLNYVVSGTTSWIYDDFRLEAFGCVVTSTGERLGIGTRMPELVTSWRDCGVPLPRLRITPWLLSELRHAIPERPQRDLLLGAAAVLEEMGLIPVYREARLSYLPDMLHNGLTRLTVLPAAELNGPRR